MTGAFFKPLALSYTLAIVASLVVALTVTPALTLILLRRTPDRAARLRRWCGDCSAGTRRCWPGSSVGQGEPAQRSASSLLAGAAVVPFLGQSLLPSFKERFLMHWVTDPSASHPEETRVTIQQASCAIPGVRNFGAHIGQALLMDEVVISVRTGSASTPVDYDQTLAAINVVDGYPGIYRDADLPEGADPRGAHRRQRGRRRPPLRRGPAHAPADCRGSSSVLTVDGLVEDTWTWRWMFRRSR